MSKINLKSLAKKKWYIEHYDGCPAFTEMTGGGFSYPTSGRIPNNKINLSYYKDRQGDWLTLLSDYEGNGRATVEIFLKNQKIFDNFSKKWQKDLKILLTLYPKFFTKNLSKLTNQQFLNWANDIYDSYKKITVPAFFDGFILYGGHRLEFLIRDFCQKHKSKKFSKFFAVLGAPVNISFFKQAEQDFKKIISLLFIAGYQAKLKLADFLNKNFKIKKLIDNYLLKYSWIKSSYLGYKKYSLTDLKKEIDKILKEKSWSKKEDIFRKNKAEKIKLIKKYKFTPEILAITRAAEKTNKMQEERKIYTLTFVALQEKILKEVSRRSGISLELLRYTQIKEIGAILKGKFNINKLKNRQKSSFFVYQHGQVVKIYTGQVAKNFLHIVKSKIKFKNVNEITGIIASPGKARGRVSLITSIKDLKKMKSGDILVAGMTRPEHLPGMKKAAAIITDDGGITCHAAIVSRELGVPCIVGTKIATKVLKDGQMVEVDAEKGIVKILK